MQDTLIKVKKEMGSNVVILHSRKLKKGGFLGLFSKYYIEVTAAVDNQENKLTTKHTKIPLTNVESITEEHIQQEKEKKHDNKTQENEPIKQENVKPFFTVESKPDEHEVNDLFKELYKKPYHKSNQEQPQIKNKGESRNSQYYRGKEMEVLKKDIFDVKSMVSQISEKMIINSSISDSKPDDLNNPYYKEAYGLLINQGILPELANDVIKKAKNNNKDLNFWKCLAHELEVPFSEPITLNVESGKPVIAALIGPTGVGKTTTIAKLAAHYTLQKSKKVALITSDTYRIAAIDQLQTYGEILNVPVQVIYNPGDIAKAIEKFSGYDLILIDTAGRSHKNKMQISELKAYLENKNHIIEIYLVLSVTTKYLDLIEIINSFDVLKNAKVIFTKIDETNHYGTIFNILFNTRKNLSYITVGQNVPEDIEIANSQKMVKLLLGDAYNERSS